MSIDVNVASQVKSQAELVREVLRSIGGAAQTIDESVARHEAPANKVSLPVDMTPAKGAKILQQVATSEQEEQVFHRTFKYRPWDGAVALNRVMLDVFGTAGRGLSIQSFFGSQPPQMVDIEVGYGETIQVPWGRIEFEPFEGTIDLGGEHNEEYGSLFHMTITAKKRYAKEIEVFFGLVEEQLKNHSIYKGKAIRGTDNPSFLSTTTDPSIVFNRSTEAQINSYVWGVIRNSKQLRGDHIKIDPKVLFHGTFGTGKSELGRLTAKVAIENGWTFISIDSGKSTLDDLHKSLQTARLLSPAVVWVEDIDIFMDNHDDKKTSQLLEMFDGVSSKDKEVMVLMTTNHLDKLAKGSVRAGRINKMVEIGMLDEEATERLIRATCGHILGEVNFAEVYEAVKDYEPSFIRQTFDDAKQSAIINHIEKLTEAGTLTEENAKRYTLNTEDFVNAANVMRTQHALFTNKTVDYQKPTIENIVADVVVKALSEKVSLYNNEVGTIHVNEPAN